jgi:hypothetical protein
MSKVIYVSGPMSGMPHYNFPAFNTAANMLRSSGFGVINPADFGSDAGISWRKCLERDLMVMFHADVVVTLPGWEKSKGAQLETHVATALGIPVMTIREFINETISGSKAANSNAQGDSLVGATDQPDNRNP